MNKIEAYRQVLQNLTDWEPYLLAESHLPGPRGNLELVQAAADLASPEQIERLLAHGPEPSDPTSPLEFLAVCGSVALGRLLAEGQMNVLERLRALANDPRWRVREGVAMALQRWGDVDMEALLKSLRPWLGGTLLEQRGVSAAVCEPRLLKRPADAREVLDLLNQITLNLTHILNRRTNDFKTLRQTLGYCWSVAVAAYPEEGMAYFESLSLSTDPDVAWIVRENLKKQRLKKIAPA